MSADDLKALLTSLGTDAVERMNDSGGWRGTFGCNKAFDKDARLVAFCTYKHT